VAVVPETWPARYRIHKYWSRKPSDEVARRITRATSPGDLVVDPFCGSGVAPIEAALLGRRAIGIDLNPFAIHLARATAMDVDAGALHAAGRRVLAAAEAEEARWHVSRCRRCGADARLAGTARRGHETVAVLVRCGRCGLQREPPDAADLARSRASDLAGDGGAPRPPVFTGWQTRKLLRAGVRDFGELFTVRNLRGLAALRREIALEDDPALRALLQVALTGCLAQASRMMADTTPDGGGASWKINIYWLPERSLELDPFRCFANRLQRVVAAKRAPAPAWQPAFHVGDARRLTDFVAPRSVDHVFADPPYGGEGIQYAELSALWCAWLDPPLRPALDDEIGENPTRGRTAADFATGLAVAFRAIREVLRDDGLVTVTFASSRPASWAALRAALAGAGLRVDSESTLGRSAPSLTGRVARGATRADAWLECRPAGPRR
jgi:16S rRNA G966 N2-methylase RsmD